MIQFPKEKSLRKIWFDRSQNQKAALTLSIASVLALTIFINEWAFNSRVAQLELSGQGRGLASVSTENQMADIRWEHELARKLASAELAKPAVLAEKPSLRDELVFGQLQGKYGVKSIGGKITEVEFLNQNAGDQPVKISDRMGFIKSYSALFAQGTSTVSLKSASTQSEVYSLIDSKNNILGTLKMDLDPEGRVLNLKIQQ